MYSSEDLELFDRNKDNSKSPKEPFNIEQLSIACIAANNSTFKTQNSNWHCRVKKMYEMVNKQVTFLTAFPSSQMNRAKFALVISWRGNV